ncbi:MAG TPA: LysM peptidoglycan-binding domain-containing protein [Treponemataceae bacterium]|nr:LysM peptidoglycan-binding domain-containing protein [Treponemataceae bacterium]
MGAASIGIKLADSKFFPVLDEGSPDSKILDLTTVRDNQTSVQINLFRDGGEETVENAEYVGTLIIEDIAEKKAGDPTIELKLSLDELNELHAEAVDMDSGSRQVLTVSLETLDQSALFNLPDFDISAHETDVELGHDPDHENLVMQGPIPGNAPEGLFEMNNEEEKKGGVFMPAWLCILILAVGVLALVLALLVSARVMLLNRSMQEAAANAPAQVSVPAVEPAPAPEPAPEATTPPPVETTEPAPAATVTEEPVVPAAPEPAPEAEATHYKIKWGDTLWDISESYYKTPWRYPEISKFNKIKNPNLIISGTYIDIPPK